ncbi:LytR/AlgR family response regulator transcription factor [Amedibacillus sp. YH-ame10]
MIRIAIIDDDLNDLETFIVSYFEEKSYIFVVDRFSFAKDYLEKKELYDIVFLDVELPDMNGLELAKIIRDTNIEGCICFFTSHKKYALKAYHVHAFDFIEKPATKFRVFKTIDDIFAYHNKQICEKTKICFSSRSEKHDLYVNEIIYFEYFDYSKDYFNRTTIIYTMDNKIALRLRISKVYEELPSDIFFIPHKSFIVNISNIISICGNLITMKNGDIVPLSQKRATQFRKKFKKYIEKQMIV